MTAMVALLRGINVGRAARLRMADLREVVIGCGYQQVRTHIQSGNVLLVSDDDATTVATRLRHAIAEQTNVAPDVLVRTRDELAAVVAANPYVDRVDAPTQLHVVFLHEEADSSFGDVTVDDFAPEHATAIGREVYLFLPDGIGRSKLATALTRGRRSTGTARNWRTVVTLLHMTDDV